MGVLIAIFFAPIWVPLVFLGALLEWIAEDPEEGAPRLVGTVLVILVGALLWGLVVFVDAYGPVVSVLLALLLLIGTALWYARQGRHPERSESSDSPAASPSVKPSRVVESSAATVERILPPSRPTYPAAASRPRTGLYLNHCWDCAQPIDSRLNRRCKKCRWYICSCRACAPDCKR